jgi:hypothetical protein
MSSRQNGNSGLTSILANGSLDPRADEEFGDELMEEGYTLVWIGRQFDVPKARGLMRVYPPLARNNDDSPIAGIPNDPLIQLTACDRADVQNRLARITWLRDTIVSDVSDTNFRIKLPQIGVDDPRENSIGKRHCFQDLTHEWLTLLCQ